MSYQVSQATSYQSIYRDTPNYKNLRTGDQEFFDALFLPLLVHRDLTWSNEEIAENLKKDEDSEPIPISTVEKRISRLKKAKLITGGYRRVRDKKTLKWITEERHLRLDPMLFVFMEIQDREQRIMKARLEAINKDLDPKLEAYQEKPKHDEPAEPPPQAFKVKVSFN